jgi:hypothetical protein
LVEALDLDPELAEAFHNLTPGAAEKLCDQSQPGEETRNANVTHRQVPREYPCGKGRNGAVN